MLLNDRPASGQISSTGIFSGLEVVICSSFCFFAGGFSFLSAELETSSSGGVSLRARFFLFVSFGFVVDRPDMLLFFICFLQGFKRVKYGHTTIFIYSLQSVE